jgi:hypothetical protein
MVRISIFYIYESFYFFVVLLEIILCKGDPDYKCLSAQSYIVSVYPSSASYFPNIYEWVDAQAPKNSKPQRWFSIWHMPKTDRETKMYPGNVFLSYKILYYMNILILITAE